VSDAKKDNLILIKEITYIRINVDNK